MRLFVSLPLPERCIETIQAIQDQLLQKAVFEGKFIAAADLHCTLAFFGSVAPEQVIEIKERLVTIQVPEISLSLGDVSINSRSNPHVIWVNLDSPALAVLAQEISERFPEFKQERAFNGHITIARIKKIEDKSRFLSVITDLKVPECSWIATSFELVSSKTLPEGPVYETLAVFRAQQTNLES